jgi:hypothetical protein
LAKCQRLQKAALGWSTCGEHLVVGRFWVTMDHLRGDKAGFAMRTCLIVMTILCWSVSLAVAERRVALVIGNGAYSEAARLANPANDASAMAAVLQRLGFSTTVAVDVDRSAIIAAIDAFSGSLDSADIAFLYYAGHGIQIAGQNFLLPIDVDVSSERTLRYSALDIAEIVAEMELRAKVAIVVLDACRDNPFTAGIAENTPTGRSVQPARGLAPMQLSGRGALVAYAAAAGAVASDGDGLNSPYAAALMSEIEAPGVEVGLMFRRAAGRVFKATDGKQQPELLVRLVDEVYLKPAAEMLTDDAAGKPDDAIPDGPSALPIAAGESVPPVEEVTVVAIAPGQAPMPQPETAMPAVEAVEEPLTNVVAPVVMVDAAAVVRPAVADRGFFGERPIRVPDWAATIAAPPVLTWVPEAASELAEQADNDSFGRAQDIGPNAIVVSSIVPRGDSDWYAIEVPLAGVLTVRGQPPEMIDLYARIHDEDGKVLGDWQGPPRVGGMLDARFELPRPGRFTLQVKDGSDDADSADVFPLAIGFVPSHDPMEPNNDPASAWSVPSTLTTNISIFPRADADWFQFFAPVPGELTVELQGVPPSIDAYVRVLDLNHKVILDWVGPARAGGDVFADVGLVMPGTYRILIKDGSDDASDTATFTANLVFTPVPDPLEPNESFAEAALVPAGFEGKLAIYPRQDQDWLAIDVDHPGELRFVAANMPEDVDAYVRVYDANKDVIRDWVGPARKGGDVEGFADLPRPGRYFIQIKDGSDDVGSTKLFDLEFVFTPQADQFEPNNSQSEATPLTPGGLLAFNILPRGDADWFRINTAEQGELSVLVDESPDNLDLYFRVYDENNKVIRDWVGPPRAGGSAEGFADLPESGSYYLQVKDGSDDQRSVSPAVLSTRFIATGDLFEPNNSFGAAQPLALGKKARGAILPRGDQDWFLLDAPRAGVFHVVVDDVDADLDLYVRLLDGDGKVIADWFGPPRKGGVTDAELSVPAAGSYRLLVKDGSDDGRSVKPYGLIAEFR